MLDKKAPVKLSLSIDATFTDNVRRLQRRRRDPGLRSGARQPGRDARRPSRFVAYRHRRDRQRRRLRRGHGGVADPQTIGVEAAPDDPRRALDRRRAGLLRFARLRREALRQSEDRLQRTPEHAKLAAYFNLDNGSGRIRGVNLQGNEAVRPIFEAWLRPFTLSRRDDADDAEYGRDRSHAVRRGRPARLPVHPGSAELRDEAPTTRAWMCTKRPCPTT